MITSFTGGSVKLGRWAAKTAKCLACPAVMEWHGSHRLNAPHGWTYVLTDGRGEPVAYASEKTGDGVNYCPECWERLA